jgi:hypothetical protein
MIGALDSPLGPHSESDIETNMYSVSTPIAIKMSPIVKSVLYDFKKATTSLQEVIKAWGSPLGPPLKRKISLQNYTLALPYQPIMMRWVHPTPATSLGH